MLMENRLKYEFMLIGSIIVILFSRLYVLRGYPLGVYYNGIMLHHIYYGFILVIISWFILVLTDDMEWDNLDRSISFVMGAGLGFIADEINFLFYWKSYSLSDYWSPVNIVADMFLILVLIYLWKGDELTLFGEKDIS